MRYDTDVIPYPWMFEWTSDGEVAGHRAWQFKDVREAYDDLPETSTTFKVTTLEEDISSGDHEIVGSMVAYLGAWQSPKRFTQARRHKWVNHRSKWALKYSDAAVPCTCGSVKYYTEPFMTGRDFDQQHADSCTKIDKSRVEYLIWVNRARVIRQAALNHHSKRMISERIGVKDPETVGYQCRNLLDIEYDTLRQRGYWKWRATMLELIESHGFSKSDLSSIFGKSRSTLIYHINGDLKVYNDDSWSHHGVTSSD